MIKEVSFLRSPASTTLFEILVFLRIISCFTASIIYLIFCLLSNSQLIKGSTIYSVFHFSAFPSPFFTPVLYDDERGKYFIWRSPGEEEEEKEGTASRNS